MWRTELNTQESTRRTADGVEASASLRLNQETVERFVDALHTDLAATPVLYRHLTKHHWNVAGAERRDRHLFSGEAAEGAEERADALAAGLGDYATAHVPREGRVETEAEAHHIEQHPENDTLVAG